MHDRRRILALGLAFILFFQVVSISIPVIPQAEAQVNLVQNGDFTQGLAFWTPTTIKEIKIDRPVRNTYPIFEIHTSDSVQLDNPSLAIDVPGGADGYEEQSVSIPPSSSVTLSFRTWGHKDSVTATVSIIDSLNNDNVITQFVPMCKIDPGCSITENKSFDITQFNGQTVKLRLRVTSSSGDGAFADFDDVQITVALPRTTLSITNVNFQSDSQFVSGWINLDNPFSSWQEARDYVFTVNSAGHVGDEAARNFGSIPVTMDITNTGTVKAIDVNAVIDVQYTLDYNACFEILLCTSHGTYARGDQKLVQLGDINPGESIHVNTSFDIRFASVMALFAFVPPGEWSAIVITAVPKFGGVATQETVSAAGRNTDIVSVKVPYSIGGLNTAEIGVALILEAASSAGADLAKNLNDLAVGVGNSAGVNTQFAVQAGKILSGQRKEIFYEVVANAFHLTIFLTHQGSTIKLVAVDPDESTYSIKTHEGVGEISVENPIPGSWKIRVIGVDLPSDGESFTTNISSAARNTFCGKTSDKFDNIIHGTPIDDELVGTNRNDLIFGLEGNDIINGKKGNDCLIGGSGNDEIRGGAGNDVIEGNEGDDTIYGGSGNDKINGGDDNDLCKGGKGNNVINNCEDLTATGSELE